MAFAIPFFIPHFARQRPNRCAVFGHVVFFYLKSLFSFDKYKAIHFIINMNITIEQNQVILNLDEVEFPLFEAMAGNGLQRMCPTDFVGGTFLNKDYLNLWSESAESG